MEISPQRFLIIMVSWMAGVLIVLGAFNTVVDPKLENGLFLIKGFNQVKFTNDNTTTAYYFDKLRRQKSTVIFGTSVSHILSSKITKRPVLNLHSYYGNPYAVLNFLEQLDEKQIANIETLYYFIDLHTFNDKKFYNPINLNLPFPLIGILRAANPGNIFLSIRTLVQNVITNSGEKIVLSPFGPMTYYLEPEDGSRVMFDVRKQFRSAEITFHATDPLDFTQDAIETLGKVDAFVKRHHLKIIYFTGTLPDGAVYHLDFNLLEKQWLAFTQKIDGFLNLWYVEGISNNFNSDGIYFSFEDVKHLNEEGIQVIWDKILSQPNSLQSSYWVNKENAQAQLEALKKKGRKTHM